MAQNGGRDAELDLELKEGSHTGFCFEEKQKTALSQMDIYCTYYT